MFYSKQKYSFFLRNSFLTCLILLFSQKTLAQLDAPFWDTLSFINLAPHKDEGLARSETKRQFVEDQEGNIWVATELGLYRYDGYEALNFSRYLINKFPEFNQVGDPNNIAFDGYSNLWIGTSQGLLVYDFEIDELKIISLGKAITAKNYRNSVEHLEVINGLLYVMTKNGLTIIDTEIEKITNQYFNTSTRISGRATNYGIRSVRLVNDSLLYVMTHSGIHKINQQTGAIEIFTAPFRKPNEHWLYNNIISQDSFFMGSWGSGLVSFNLKTNRFSKYKIPHPGVPSKEWNFVTTIREVNDTMMMMTMAQKGLGAYDIKNHKFHFIPKAHGNHREVFIDSKGYAWVGKPSVLARSNVPIRIPSSSDFNLSISRVLHNKKELARPSTDRSQALILDEQPSKQISLSLAVSHQDILKGKLGFRYKINNEAWISLDREQTIQLRNLSAGNNNLIIQASLDDELLDEKEYTFSVKIPIYKQVWFWILIVMLMALLSYFWYLEKIKRLKKEQTIVMEYEKQLARLETMALRSQMNPHFIFNSVNSIKGLIINDKKEEASDQLTRFAKFMRNILNYSDQDLITLADEISFLKAYCKLEQFKHTKTINYQVYLDPSIDKYEVLVPPFLLQPFLENSFKYAFKDSKITDAIIDLSITKENGFLLIKITDNGIGEKANKENEHLSKGINIVKKRLELRNGTEGNLSVTFNGYLQGTTVDLKIKIDD